MLIGLPLFRLEAEMDYPCFMYHEKKGAVLFKDEKQFKETGKDFVDSPAKFKKEKKEVKETKKATVKKGK